jgi:hypothetical protein
MFRRGDDGSRPARGGEPGEGERWPECCGLFAPNRVSADDGGKANVAERPRNRTQGSEDPADTDARPLHPSTYVNSFDILG